LFRRTKTETPAATATPDSGAARESGKGRPTPTRKEAEAAAKARAKAPRTRREMAAYQRQHKTESSKKIRQAMKEGDERYFLVRDQGPVRRFIRDYVDARFSFLEIMIPVMLATLVLGYSGNATLAEVGNIVLIGMFLMIIVDMVTLRFRLRRELARRFPEASTKGTTYYAITRAMQMKFMRMPKPKVRIGAQLSDRYR